MLLLLTSSIVSCVFNLSGGDFALSRPTQTMLGNLKAYVRKMLSHRDASSNMKMLRHLSIEEVLSDRKVIMNIIDCYWDLFYFCLRILQLVPWSYVWVMYIFLSVFFFPQRYSNLPCLVPMTYCWFGDSQMNERQPQVAAERGLKREFVW